MNVFCERAQTIASAADGVSVSICTDGCADGKSLSLPPHMNHLNGKYKVLCFKENIFLISLYERVRYFHLSLINTDKLSSQAGV